jgi:hypothetical protein
MILQEDTQKDLATKLRTAMMKKSSEKKSPEVREPSPKRMRGDVPVSGLFFIHFETIS